MVPNVLLNLPQIFFMKEGYAFTVAERLMRYVQIDTQSDPNSNGHPTSEKQKELSNFFSKNIYFNFYNVENTLK